MLSMQKYEQNFGIFFKIPITLHNLPKLDKTVRICSCPCHLDPNSDQDALSGMSGTVARLPNFIHFETYFFNKIPMRAHMRAQWPVICQSLREGPDALQSLEFLGA